MNLKNKTVLLTGATGGIGSVLASHLAHEGAKLVLIGRDLDKLASLQQNLSNPNSHKIFSCDLSNRQARDKLASKLNKELVQLHLLIHSAGIGIYKPIEDIDYQDWDTTFQLNLEAPYFLTKHLEPLLTKSSGLVLTIGSGAGVIPMRGRSLYCTSKFALRGAILSLAEEFRGSSPQFTLITLGSTLTPFGPMSLEEKQKENLEGKAYFTPEWVANKLVEIIKLDKRETEYTLYPGDYGFGTWQKP